ncbi:MAG: UDP-N-acetylglucosamine 1-carboxyvinyltransferase [Clostridia bacterium]|nr:UDP-N-acetylglucosamine 1-carboxyvinyltransferase [Clostridia bacterium]
MAKKEFFTIQGGTPLRGEVKVSGGKNAAVAIIPATLLANSPCTIENLPNVSDVHVLADMLEWLGAGVEFDGDTMRVDPTTVNRFDPPYELARKIRASYYLVPVLMARFGRANVPMPGGCDIGARPVDQTIKGWTLLGADVNTQGGVFNATGEHLTGADVHLDMPSVGATVNTMLAAVCAEGNTVIHNAAKEPHIVDLANFLGSMGAWVKGAGTDTIRIRGGRPLHGSAYAVIPDQIETGTLMIAAAATGGDVVLTDTIPFHMEALSAKLLEMGVYVHDEDDRIHVRGGGSLRSINVKTQYYPGFPTDLQQPLVSMLTTVGGTSFVTENIYEARFRYVDELRRMGVNIRVVERGAIVEGVDRLTSAPVAATDLRASAALVIAGLIAEGTTEISNGHFIRRGYENIDKKLTQLGAQVEWSTRESDD